MFLSLVSGAWEIVGVSQNLLTGEQIKKCLGVNTGMVRWMTGGLENWELEANLPELLNLSPPLDFLEVRGAAPLTILMLSSQFSLLTTPALRQQQAKLNQKQLNAGYLVQIRQAINSCVLGRCSQCRDA